jgi:hypothetical protein
MPLEEVEEIMGGPSQSDKVVRRDGLQVIVEREWNNERVLAGIQFSRDEKTGKERVSGFYRKFFHERALPGGD